MAHFGSEAPRPLRAPIKRVPDMLLRGAAIMVVFSLAIVTFARVTGMEPAAMPPADVAVVQERLIQIIGTADGGATVVDAEGTTLAELDATKAGFIGGVARSLGRERMLHKVADNPPVLLTRYADGRLGLRDPATGWRVELIGFGETNRDAFAALLD
jgi:putative photosynthetic complex assembly protein